MASRTLRLITSPPRGPSVDAPLPTPSRTHVGVDFSDGSVHVMGVLDATTTTTMRDCMLGAAAEQSPVRVDLGDLELLSAAGTRSLESAVVDVRAAGHDVVLVAGEASLARRVITVCRSLLGEERDRLPLENPAPPSAAPAPGHVARERALRVVRP